MPSWIGQASGKTCIMHDCTKLLLPGAGPLMFLFVFLSAFFLYFFVTGRVHNRNIF